MKKLLVMTLTVLALGAFASPTFADEGGTPNSNAAGAAGSSNAHGGDGNNNGNQSGGDNGTDTDPQGGRGNDSGGCCSE